MSQNIPYFSLLFPAYNAQATVTRALDSVLEQDFGDWELIAVDDGSTDKTLEILEKYALKDDRIRVISQKNLGVGAARHRAQELSSGYFLMNFDADDVMDEHLLSAMKRCIINNPRYDFYSCNGFLTTYDSVGKIISQRPYVSSPRFKSETSLNLSDIMEEPYILSCGSAVSRDLVKKTGGYREGFRAEDFDFWVRAFLAGAKHFYTPDMLYYYTKGLKDQMNADQTLSYASFVASIDDALLNTPHLKEDERRLLEQGRITYRYRTDPAYYELSAVNEELALQSARFYERLEKLFPKRIAKILYSVAYCLKKPLDPVRIALARKKKEKSLHE